MIRFAVYICDVCTGHFVGYIGKKMCGQVSWSLVKVVIAGCAWVRPEYL